MPVCISKYHWITEVILALLVIVLLIPGICLSQENGEEQNNQYESWMSLPPRQQLYMEGLDDQKGMGRLFVPSITNPSSEPYYAVFKGDELIGEQLMGSSFFLLPGHYTVRFGAGSILQRVTKEIDIRRGETLILEPEWSAITIEVIDESRNYVKRDLQIYHIKTLENYGIIPAINPELGEKLQTLLLEPGLYKIVERGGDPNTFVNFATVLLEPGTYTPYTVVINSTTGDFIGSGILTAATRLRLDQAWRRFAAVHGTFIINNANTVTKRDRKTNISLLSQLENRIQYDKFPHYYLTNNLLELGALKQGNESFNISQDRLQLKNTYVYYFLPILGGYVRFETSTHLFETLSRFEDPRDLTFRDLDGNDVERLNQEKVILEPSLFPLGLKEGMGINLTALRTFTSRLNLRAGFGYRQTYNKDVYKQSSEDPNRYERIPDNFVQGVETSLLSSFSFLNNLTITTELDMLFPTESVNKPVVDLENTSSFEVTRNVTIEHVLRWNRDPDFDWDILEQYVSVRISYFFF